MSSKAEIEKRKRIESIMHEFGYDFIFFKGGDLMRGPGTSGFVPFDARMFSRLVQNNYPGTTENMTSDFAKTVKNMSPDWSEYDHLIAMRDKVWDMKRLEFVDDQLEFVYSTSIAPQPADSKGYDAALQFLMELAAGDEDLARDYLQSMAPLLMYRKPAGVLWFVGSGANGKSALLNALYRIFGKHFASLSTSAIEDGKAALALQGVLGNIVREASESRVEDTANYKAIGTHEPFHVRRLYTQDLVTVETNFHTIFNANNIPSFSDKTKGARRRTLVVPFPAHFEDDPNFEDKTFTPEFLGGLLTLLLEETERIRENHYNYKWSDATLRAKASYDSEVNSVEAFLTHLHDSGIVAFSNYTMLKMNYENWCGQNGLVPLGMTTLKRTMVNDGGVIRKSVRFENHVGARYFLSTAPDKPIVWLDNGYGLVESDEEPVAPLAEQTKLPGGW